MESHRDSHVRARAQAQIIVARLAVSVAGAWNAYVGRFFMRHDQTTWAWIQGGLGGSVSCFEVV